MLDSPGTRAMINYDRPWRFWDSSPVHWKSNQYSLLRSHLSTPRCLSYDKGFQIALYIDSTDFLPNSYENPQLHVSLTSQTAIFFFNFASLIVLRITQ